MIPDSLLLMLFSGILGNIDVAAPPGWVLDSVVVTVNYEVEILIEDVIESDTEPTPVRPAVSRDFALIAQHPWLVTSWPLDAWRLHQQWGFESSFEGSGGVYSFSRHPLGLGWDFRLALIHEFVPFHAQEARWTITHGVF